MHVGKGVGMCVWMGVCMCVCMHIHAETTMTHEYCHYSSGGRAIKEWRRYELSAKCYYKKDQ